MTRTSKPIVFFGTEDFSLTALTGLIEAGYQLAGVVTKPDSRKGRGQKLMPPRVAVLASRHNLPVWQPARLSELTSAIKRLSNPLGVLVSYGKIIPAPFLELFPDGIINLHPSLLPRYRGPSPIESAILNGDDKTGVSIMRLAPKMDAGPVYAAKECPLSGIETRPELYHTLATLGTNFLLEVLPDIISGSLVAIPQDDSQASYCRLLTKDAAWLDPSRLTAAAAERRVRAYLGFPKTKCIIGGHTVIVTQAQVNDQPKTPLDIICQDGAVLSITELIAPSGKRMSASDFLRGYPALLT